MNSLCLNSQHQANFLVEAWKYLEFLIHQQGNLSLFLFSSSTNLHKAKKYTKGKESSNTQPNKHQYQHNNQHRMRIGSIISGEYSHLILGHKHHKFPIITNPPVVPIMILSLLNVDTLYMLKIFSISSIQLPLAEATEGKPLIIMRDGASPSPILNDNFLTLFELSLIQLVHIELVVVGGTDQE